MKLSQIEQVLEVARVGSISQAAENLYMSQPKLSLSIKQLELDVGKDLANYKYVMAMHAFYEDHMTKAISFDAVIDFKCKDATYLVAQIEKDLGEKYGRTFRIQIDRAYSD